MEPIHRNLTERAKDSAKDHMPALPAQNTLEAWQAYMEELEGLDVRDAASQEADSWDWVIYYGQAMALCTAVPSRVLGQAESQVEDCGGIESAFENGGLYGVACQCAYWIVQAAMVEALEEAQAELIEFAQSQIDNLEGA